MNADAMEAESAVCGSILLDASCLGVIMEHISADDFALEANRAIFSAAVELDKAGETVDPVTIRNLAGDIASRDYMFELIQYTGTAANAEVYAIETRRASMRRSLRSLAETIANSTGVSDDPREVIANAQRALEAIEEQDTGRELSTSADTMLAYYAHREAVDSGKGGFVPTGVKTLDWMLGGGMLNTGFYILAARPGMGKTTLALSIADYVAANIGPVLYVSLEMDEEQMAGKRIARAAGIGYDALMMGKLSDDERKRSAEHSAKLAAVPLYMNKKASATIDDISNMARKVKDLQLLVIDYFGLIRSTEKRGARYELYTGISGEIKSLARKLKKPILCLAQLNRENNDRKDKRPQLSDLRDTGALEQDADGVIFLHCPSYYSQEKPDPWGPDPMEIILAKNRHARTGTCEAAFYRAVGRIIPAKMM